MGITHRVLCLGLGKDALDRLFALFIEILIFKRIPHTLSQFYVILPDMARHRLLTAFGIGTYAFTSIPGKDVNDNRQLNRYSNTSTYVIGSGANLQAGILPFRPPDRLVQQ